MRRLLRKFNQEFEYDDTEGRQALLTQLLGRLDPAGPPFIEPPFNCEYGMWQVTLVPVLPKPARILLAVPLQPRSFAGKRIWLALDYTALRCMDAHSLPNRDSLLQVITFN